MGTEHKIKERSRLRLCTVRGCRRWGGHVSGTDGGERVSGRGQVGHGGDFPADPTGSEAVNWAGVQTGLRGGTQGED